MSPFRKGALSASFRYSFLVILTWAFVILLGVLVLGLHRGSAFNFLSDWTKEFLDDSACYGTGRAPSSACSCRADRRGPNQNVIAYSLYGNFSDTNHFERYVAPFKTTLHNIGQVYPGWTVRIYFKVDSTVDYDVIREHFSAYPHVDLCNSSRVLLSHSISSSAVFPMTWRFLPLVDPLVGKFMSRDSDSIILDREVNAVEEWLEDGASFHIMRDHEGHCFPMLGGLWGVKMDKNRSAIHRAATALLKHKLDPQDMIKGADQLLLVKFLWPLAIHDMVVHDSYCCIHYPQSSRPFPTQRKGAEYLGDIFHLTNAQQTSPAKACPTRCRPKNHTDWLFC